MRRGLRGGRGRVGKGGCLWFIPGVADVGVGSREYFARLKCLLVTILFLRRKARSSLPLCPPFSV